MVICLGIGNGLGYDLKNRLWRKKEGGCLVGMEGRIG